MEFTDSERRREPLSILLKQSKLRELKRILESRQTMLTAATPIQRRGAEVTIDLAQDRIRTIDAELARLEG